MSIRDLCPSNIVAESFSNYIEQAADRCLRKTNGHPKNSPIPQNDWYDDECKNARKLIKQADTAKAPDHVISNLECEYNRIIQRKKRRSKLQNSDDLMHTNNPTEMWRKLKRIGSKNEGNATIGLKDFYNHFSKPAVQNNGNILKFDLSFQNEILEFMKCYKEKSDTYLYSKDENSQLISDVLNSCITDDEVFFALNSLKKGESPGIDGIPIDV